MIRLLLHLVALLVVTTTRSQAREQYFLLNYSTSLNAPQQAQDMMSHVRDTFGAANRASRRWSWNG